MLKERTSPDLHLQALARATARHLAAPEFIDLIADAVADRLIENLDSHQAPRAIDAAEVGRRLAVSRETVYRLADELGAVRIGGGARPRLRFDPRRVDAYLAASEQPSGSTPTRPPARKRPTSRTELLPIRGQR